MTNECLTENKHVEMGLCRAYSRMTKNADFIERISK